MVLACHQAGIEVLLDFPFTANTSFQMINSCLRYYVREYHVDGFILNPWNVSIELLRQDPFLKGSRLYRKEDEFQNTIRRFLRGEEGMTSLAAAQLARSSAGTDRFNYVTGHTGFTLRDLFSYDSKHNEANGEGNQDGPENNYSWNCGAEGDTSEEAVLELRKKLICCAFAFLLTAQGVPVLLAGDEFGNSQKGNNNVYCQDNELSWLDWTCLDKEKRLYTYVKELIAFRKQHKILHQRDQLTGMDRRGCGLPDFSCHGDTVWREPDRVSGRLLGILYGEAESGGEVCYIIYNMHWLRHMVGIPNPGGGRKWFLAADSERGVLRRDKPLKNQREIEVEPRTVHILIGRKP